MALFSFSTENIMAIVWAVFVVVTAIIELNTNDLVTIWFTVGGVCALVAALFKLNITIQVVIFVLVSVVAILLTRPIAIRMQQKEIIRTNSDKIIGKIATVTIKIETNEIGEVKVESRLWRAINNDGSSFEVGEKVIINAISGTKLIVSKIEDTNKEIIL